MNYQKKRSDHTMAVAFIVCLFTICLSMFSICSTYRLSSIVSVIYEHPYRVSNEARAMRSRLWDMRSYLLEMIAQPDQATDGISQLLAERYAAQYEAIKIITEQYLGPEEQPAALLAAMQALEQVQSDNLSIIIPMSYEDTLAFAEANFFPYYDAVDDAITTILNTTDNRILGIENSAKDTANRTLLSNCMLTFFLPAFFLFIVWRERKNTREIIYREHLFDVLSTNVNEVFLIHNQEKNCLEYISANCERVLHLPPDVFTNASQPFSSYIIEEDHDAYKAFVQAIKTHQGESVDFRICLPGGEIRWVRLQSFPEINNGVLTRYIISISDGTDEMRKEQVLKDALLNAQNANAAKQNFLARMSHEIRTPMNAIIGMTAIAAVYIDDRNRVENCLEKISFSSKHLMELINDVLDMSKIEEGKMTIAHEAFTLEGITESTRSIFYPQAVAKGLTFTIALVDVTDTCLIGDSLRLNQVLLNLLSNAIKFTPEGGFVRLEIHQIQKKNERVRLRFTVSDSGIGMNEDFLERMFMPFEQENATTGQQFGGTGLGMSICKNLVTLMGGTISVKSKPHEGTTLIVELDFDISEPAEESSMDDDRALERLKVLIADDDRDCCIHTSLILEKMGISSHWVQTGMECVNEALRAFKIGTEYDVCIIDWKMPDVDGIETTRRIREAIGPDTPIIIITAYDWTSIEQSAREAGANAFLSKPLFPSTLYNTLLSVTGIKKAAQAYHDMRSHPILAGRRVLLAEDNELNREIAVEILKLVGMETDCASNGEEAVKKFLSQQDDYSLILMDIQMPIMNGYDAVRAIRGADHPKATSIPIIAMTANAFHEDVVASLAAGMDGHLAKPIDPAQLYQTLEDILGNSRETH